MFIPVIKILTSYHSTVANACLDFWSGTAPFCKGGPCPAGYHQTATSSRGDGAKCWTGQKVYCQCNTPVNTCRDYWSGTAPFCKGDTCLPGWDAKYTSNAGDGGVCWSGHKTYCQCTANTGGPLPKCVPGAVKSSCYFYQKICNNGCNLFHCGFCTSIFGKRSIPSCKSCSAFPPTCLHNPSCIFLFPRTF